MQYVCTLYTELPKCIIALMIKKNSTENPLKKYWHLINRILTLKFNEEQIYV